MAATGRLLLALFIFSLMAVLTVVPLTVIVLQGYQPPPAVPLSEPDSYSLGDKVGLILASLFCIVLLVTAWRALLHGARTRVAHQQERDASRQAIEVGGDGGRVRPSESRDQDHPPGYG